MKDLIEKVDTKLFKDGLAAGIIAIFIYILIALISKKVLDKFIDKQTWKQKQLIKKIKNIVIYVLLGIGIFSQFTFMDSLMNAMLASGGIVAVVVGLASQEAASNLVGGLMILVSKPFKIGDVIILKENNLRGEVKDITMGHTVIETLDKNLIMIPNTTINKTIIENLTYSQTEFKIAYLSVDITFESDIDEAITIMKDIVSKHPLYYKVDTNDVPIYVHCMGFTENGITLRVKVTTRNQDDSFELCSDCRIAIKKAFDEKGIQMAYPQIKIKS